MEPNRMAVVEENRGKLIKSYNTNALSGFTYIIGNSKWKFLYIYSISIFFILIKIANRYGE